MKKRNLFSKNNLFVVIALFLILSLGTFLRFWRIDIAPKGALIDELHFGYLAHSLILTGADEHGQKWPIIFEGFGDQKLPAMAYLDIPSVAVLGLTLLAIRIPSAVAGSLLILVSYWLIFEITRRKKWALLGAFITAVSPWSFFLSRFGFESNLALLGMSVGLASLFTAQRSKKRYWYIISSIGMAFSWYSYIAYRPITIILILGFVIAKLFSNYKKNIKPMALLLISFAILVAPLFLPSVIGVNNTRFGQVGITSETSTEQIINEKRNFCATVFPKPLCYIASNKPLYFLRELTHRYLVAFSPEFLVTKGELSTDFLTIDGFGQFFPTLYPLILIGIVGLLFIPDISLSKTKKWIILLGILISPIPSAFVGEPQKVRISALFPFLLISIIYGVIIVEKFLKQKVLKRLFISSVILTVLGYTFLYQMEYHGVHMIQREVSYQSYVPNLHRYLDTLPKDAIINIIPFYSDPLMFHAFYTKMDPKTYQSLAVIDDYDGANFRHTVELGNVWSHKYSPEEISCIALKKGVRGIFVTDKKLEYLDLIYHEQSTNGVNTYAYVYDVTLLMFERNCDNYEI